MKTNNKGMKTTATWAFLIALTAIGAGCSSSQPFETLTEEIAPVERAMAPEMAPEEVAEEVAPIASSDIAEEGVETLQGSILNVDKAAILDYYKKEFQRHDSDIKIKVVDDGREDVEYVIHLTPEQKQALFQKHAASTLKQIPLEKLRCRLSGQNSSDCED